MEEEDDPVARQWAEIKNEYATFTTKSGEVIVMEIRPAVPNPPPGYYRKLPDDWTEEDEEWVMKRAVEMIGDRLGEVTKAMWERAIEERAAVRADAN